jgi:bifunctional non-homologous end joining protein LigD
MKGLAPMLASIGTAVPTGRSWVFEPKYDGIRVLGSASSDGVALVTRNEIDKAKQFPEIVDALKELRRKAKRSFIIDGEIVALKGNEPARFQELQSRMHVTDAGSIARHRSENPSALIAFDILLDGRKALINEPWQSRREHLEALLSPAMRTDTLRISDVSDDGAAMLRTARQRDWEGIIAKEADARYKPGERTRSWLKLKIERRQEFVVGGWTEPRRSREHFGALLLGYYDRDGALVYAGHTGTGFTRETLSDMSRRLKRIERKASPFDPAPHTNEPAHWVKPEIVVEIKFTEWTGDGRLRHPVFIGTRDDKSPRDVTHEPESIAAASKKQSGQSTGRARRPSTKRIAASAEITRSRPRSRVAYEQPARGVSRSDAEEIAKQLADIEAKGGTGTLELPSGSLEVSNLDKVFFPETKQTKGDVMRFYARIAPFLLPAMQDRPLVMKRFPNGIRGHAFYQQKAPANPPEGVRVESVADEGLTTQERVIGGNLTTLFYLVQLGAISIDPWHSRVGSIPFADYSIIDLDPGPRAKFEHVIEVAAAVRETLDTYRLHAVPKTSGASGIHIVLPLPAGVPNDGARIVAELVATAVASRYPKIATIERWTKKRPTSAVYVDFLQNIRGKTVAGVYSVRAEPTATVSTPLAWDEIKEGLDPKAFTMDAVIERVGRVGDLWGAGMKRPNSLDGLLGK